MAVVTDTVLYWTLRVAQRCTSRSVEEFAEEPFSVPDGFPHPGVRLRQSQVNEATLAHLPMFHTAEAESCVVVFTNFSALEADATPYYRGQLSGRAKNVFLVGSRRHHSTTHRHRHQRRGAQPGPAVAGSGEEGVVH
jgi:hypothetical protein